MKPYYGFLFSIAIVLSLCSPALATVTGHASVSVNPGDTSTTGPTASETANSTHSINLEGGTSGTYYLLVVTCSVDIDYSTSSSHQYTFYQQADPDGKGSYTFDARNITKACYFGMHTAHALTRIDSLPYSITPAYDGSASSTFTVTEL